MIQNRDLKWGWGLGESIHNIEGGWMNHFQHTSDTKRAAHGGTGEGETNDLSGVLLGDEGASNLPPSRGVTAVLQWGVKEARRQDSGKVLWRCSTLCGGGSLQEKA